MNIIDPYVEVWKFDPVDIMLRLEIAGRTCYKSEDKMKDTFTVDRADRFIRKIVSSGHESVIEHCTITVKFVIDRGVSHELVRHRIGSYSQESTRYCLYGDEITVIRPFFFDREYVLRVIWYNSCEAAGKAYHELLLHGASPQEARSVLPNSLKTEIVVTYNIREWRHFFKERCSPRAHPQMRQVAIPLLYYFRDKLPILFLDVPLDPDFPEENYAKIVEVESGV